MVKHDLRLALVTPSFLDQTPDNRGLEEAWTPPISVNVGDRWDHERRTNVDEAPRIDGASDSEMRDEQCEEVNPLEALVCEVLLVEP